MPLSIMQEAKEKGLEYQPPYDMNYLSYIEGNKYE